MTVEYRWSQGRHDQLPRLAADLLRRPVTVLVSTGGTVSARAARAATQAIPIVVTTADDPVKVGFVDSLNRPGGNLTGITASFIEAAPTRMELLHELLPKGTKFGLLVSPIDPATLIESSLVQVAAGGREIDIAFEDMKQMHVDALLIAADPLLFARADQITALSAQQRIPTPYSRSEMGFDASSGRECMKARSAGRDARGAGAESGLIC